jgi:hypothetical protein
LDLALSFVAALLSFVAELFSEVGFQLSGIGPTSEVIPIPPADT